MEDEIKKTQKENEILFSAICLIPDYANGIIRQIQNNNIAEAMNIAYELQVFAFNTMSTSKGWPEIKLPQ